MKRLENRVALITGAARGQGEAIARLFRSEGAKVVLTDVLDAEGEELAIELGEHAAYVHLDVSSEEAWRAAATQAQRRFGKIDALVNNAGILKVGPLLEMDLDTYLSVIRVNQIGCFLGMKIAGQAIIDAGGGTIVNTSSTAGLWGVPYGTAYSASKFAITGMTKTAALELGPLGVRVNSIHPGAIDTAMIRGDDFEGIDPDETCKGYPLGRVGKAEEIAKVALFLSSDESSFCMGSSFTADGGVMAGEHFM